jgi:integrase
LHANPAASVEPPRPVRPTLPIVGPETALLVLEAAQEDPLEVPIVIAIGSGARLGEVVGLRWSDIDFHAERLHIRWALQRGPDGLVLVEPKSHSSRRAVSIPKFLVRTLKRHRRDQAQRRLRVGERWREGGFVIDTGDGSPVSPETVSRRFADFVRRHGLPKMRFHDLRHAHATLMLAQGVHPKVVSERLGHSSIAITLDTYSHVIPALQHEAAGVLDELFPNAGRKRSRREGGSS